MKFTSPFKLVTAVAVLSASLAITGAASAATAALFGATASGSMPRGLAIDSNGNIYTANQNNTISKVTPAGVVSDAWATGVVSNVGSIAVGPGDAVYVSNSSDSKVQKFSSSGGVPAAEPPTIANPSDTPRQPTFMTVDTSGNIYFVSATATPRTLGKITSGGTLSDITFSYQPGGIITDGAGNVYVSDQTNDTVHKYSSSLTEVTSGWPASVGTMPGRMAVDGTYLYAAYEGSSSGAGVSRVKLSDADPTAAWASGLSGFSANLTAITVASDGTVYVAATAGMMRIYAITASGTASTLASTSFQPLGLVVDASDNVYTTNFGMGPSSVAGVYKIASGRPSPTPTPSSTSSTTTTTTSSTTGKPAPGPALKVTDIPAEITLDIGSSTGGTIPADQPITAEVPCTAPEGQLLDRCTVNVTAPEYVLLGQGDGISVRADKKISIGKATVKAKSGKKVIVVKVKINQKGRKALQRNMKITATVGLTAITVSNLNSTGEANTEMRLPTQLISPQAGIFDSNSITLNKAGVAFVNRLALLLPKAPKQMTFIGFADNTGVPGDNRWLGDRRAKAVHDALEAKGITAAKSSIETKAATSPRADNAKASGRERNRRVSIRITY